MRRFFGAQQNNYYEARLRRTLVRYLFTQQQLQHPAALGYALSMAELIASIIIICC